MLLWLSLQEQPPIVETSSVDQSEYIDVEEKNDSDTPVDLKQSLIKKVSSENNFNNEVFSKDTKINFENDLISIEINNKGGFISSLFLKGFNNHLENPIYLINGKKITSSKTLKYYENLLPGIIFFRIHQKYLVNISFIKKYLKEDGGYVLLKDESKLAVSRRKKEALLNKLTS